MLANAKIGSVAATLALGLVLCGSVAKAETDPAEKSLVGDVGRIVDGDTLELIVGSRNIRIRLAEIDAPELSQPYGVTAKAELGKLVATRRVRVEIVDTDRYGRLVGEIHLDGLNVNHEMVRAGHAWAYTRYARGVEIVALEDAARRAGTGLWGLPKSDREAPWEWRRRRRGAARPSRETSPPSDPMPAECGRKHLCKEMRSCAEALFHLNECAVRTLDGDGDGVPCEQLCRGG